MISQVISKLKMHICTKLTKAKLQNVFGYASLLDCKEFQVYKRPIGGRRIETAFGNAVVLSDRRGRLYIYPDYRYPLLHYRVHFNLSNFPSLIPNSRIAYCRIIPYFRTVTEKRFVKAWRLIVVTDRGQIYHNYPSRSTHYDGYSQESDIKHFEESVIWDLQERRYPSSKKECAAFERYYPGLPEEAYAYHPAINQPSRFGNQGFPACYNGESCVLPRFYIARRTPEGNPFYYMSGFCSDYKMTIMGTYRSNTSTGVRTCLFTSDDGGRQWFCIYEFGDLGEYSFRQGTDEWGKNFGNVIKIGNICHQKIELVKRNCCVPNSEHKEPADNFIWSDATSFQLEKSVNTITLKSISKHEFKTGNIVAVNSAPKELDWMVNASFDRHSSGNGLLFKVEKVNDYCIKLHEFVASPDNPISCRHIHHINRVRDGWLIGTGEIYPNSWILYIQMKEADTFSIRKADRKFHIFRINSSEKSVQRTMGVLWRDDSENTILYASDHDILDDKASQMPIEQRQIAFSRNATGVYKGSLKNIDDFNKFVPVLEATEPAYLLQKVDRGIVFSGQRGELALSFDGGDTWLESHIDGPLTHPKGGTYQYYIFDDYLLRIK